MFSFSRLPFPVTSLLMLPVFVLLSSSTVLAQESSGFDEAYNSFLGTPEGIRFAIDNLWLLICAAFVFIMHLGFASLESGLTQSKNTVNILYKNVFIICMGIFVYFLWGFKAMYPGPSDTWNGIIALGGWFNAEGFAAVARLTDPSALSYTSYADFIFQAMFAATAATIVSGAVAERVKLSSFMVFATVLVLFAYPITGSWEWGKGWLDRLDFVDFAGSTLVHAFGGFAALGCVLVLGPRRGKYQKDGKVRPILGHSMPLATIGALLLFFGWFGFNGGSVLSADPYSVSKVFVTTALAASMGGLFSMLTSIVLLKKPDLSMALNGLLAGLVGITAGADVMSPLASLIIGAIAGVLVVISVLFFDRFKIDDPVGAISVHGVCGIWGTLAVGIWGAAPFFVQLLGTFTVSLFAFIFSFAVFSLLKVTMGVRVDEEEEYEGLDIGEHGQEAYPDFQAAHNG